LALRFSVILFRVDTELQLQEYLDAKVRISDSCWVAQSACFYGDIHLGERCSVWPHTVLRADINQIRIANEVNLQDGVIVHLADNFGVRVDSQVTVGHGAILHACSVGEGSLIGMRATILDGAVVGRECLIGAHTLVTQGMEIPDGSMVLGTPGKIVRKLSKEERRQARAMSLKYVQVSQGFKKRGLV